MLTADLQRQLDQAKVEIEKLKLELEGARQVIASRRERGTS